VIMLHLDSYIQEVLTEYKAYIKKALRPKRVPMSPGIVLNNEDCPVTPDPRKQKYYRSFIAKLLSWRVLYVVCAGWTSLAVHISEPEVRPMRIKG
jgi:hypothetical protein